MKTPGSRASRGFLVAVPFPPLSNLLPASGGSFLTGDPVGFQRSILSVQAKGVPLFPGCFFSSAYIVHSARVCSLSSSFYDQKQHGDIVMTTGLIGSGHQLFHNGTGGVVAVMDDFGDIDISQHTG